MTKFEKEARHRLYVLIKKKQQQQQLQTVDSPKCETTAHAFDAFCPLTRAWRINCSFHCPITLSKYKHDGSTSIVREGGGGRFCVYVWFRLKKKKSSLIYVWYKICFQLFQGVLTSIVAFCFKLLGWFEASAKRPWSASYAREKERVRFEPTPAHLWRSQRFTLVLWAAGLTTF